MNFKIFPEDGGRCVEQCIELDQAAGEQERVPADREQAVL